MSSQLLNSPRRRYVCTDSARQRGCGRVSITGQVDATFVEQLPAAVAGRLIETIRAAGIDDYTAANEVETQMQQQLRKGRHDVAAGTLTRNEYLSVKAKLGHRGRQARHLVHELAAVNFSDLTTDGFPQGLGTPHDARQARHRRPPRHHQRRRARS